MSFDIQTDQQKPLTLCGTTEDSGQQFTHQIALLNIAHKLRSLTSTLSFHVMIKVFRITCSGLEILSMGSPVHHIIL